MQVHVFTVCSYHLKMHNRSLSKNIVFPLKDIFTYSLSPGIFTSSLFISLCRRRRLQNARHSTSTWQTWSWSPCCCSRRWTCRSSRWPTSSRRRSWGSVRPIWKRSSCRFGTWRTTSTIFYCGSWSRRPPCSKCAKGTSDNSQRRVAHGLH